MIRLSFEEANVAVLVPKGTSVLEAARKAGVLIESPCNGALICGKCRVRIAPEDLPKLRCDGVHRLSQGLRQAGWVLACGAYALGDVRVSVPGRAEGKMRIGRQGQTFDGELGPAVHKVYDPLDNQTRVCIGDREIGREPGDTRQRLYGAAVDIGTTTLVASLLDLYTGAEIGTAAALNPQSLHAQDVLGRIRLGSEPAGLELMHSLIAGSVTELLSGLCLANQVGMRDIYEVVYCGNTAMLHLAAGLDPAPLGRFPYRSAIAQGHHRAARECRLPVSPFGQIYFPPIISAFVGADITAGLLAAKLDEAGPPTLFVDIGTNGEMVLACGDRLYAASTAAGPAFEGMNITSGMRATRGAVDRCHIAQDGTLRFSTIDEAPAEGICGSGLIDLTAELVRVGLIGPRGNLQRTLPDTLGGLREHLREREGKAVFSLGGSVILTTGDIRQVQLAKGAIRTGIELLLRHAGVEAANLKRIYIAGSFGYHLSPQSLFELGLLPRECTGRISFLGNTAHSGAQQLLLAATRRRELDSLSARVKGVELASSPDFEREFVQRLGFES